MTTSQVAGKGESMSDLEDSVDAYLDLRDQLEEAEAERDRLQRDYDDILKWMAESDAGKLAARCKQLREALERIRSFTTFEVQDSFPIYEVDAIARNALAGGSERETPDPE